MVPPVRPPGSRYPSARLQSVIVGAVPPSPVETRVKSEGMTLLFTGLEKVTVQETEAALVGLVPARTMD